MKHDHIPINSNNYQTNIYSKTEIKEEAEEKRHRDL